MTNIVRIASPHVPVSTNKAYRNATAKDRVKGRIKTKEYTTWANAFGWDVKAAMVHQKPIKGPYILSITVCRSKRHPLADVTNMEKVVSDTLQELGVIENDRFCERMTIEWGEAQGGFIAEISPIPFNQRAMPKENEDEPKHSGMG